MRIRFTHPAISLAIAATLVATACTAAATPAPTPMATPAATAAGTVAPSSTPLAGTKKFTVAFTSRGLSSVAMMEGIAVLNSKGYTIDTPEIAQSNLIVEGILQNQFQVTSGTTLSFLVAAQKNGPIRTIGNRLNNEWTLTSKAAIKTCNDTNGKVWAHHTESAVSTAMARAWVAANCTGGKSSAQEVFIQGSDVRRAALSANQIDVAELELSDAMAITAGDGATKYFVLAPFNKDLPNLKPSMIAANSTWMAANPGDVVALLKATTEINRKINADPTGAYLKGLAEKHVPNAIQAATIGPIAKSYAEAKLFPGDGGLALSDLAFTIKFFEDAGSLPKGLTNATAADLTFLNLALKELGPG
jgi:NitT/TauT family transport system substrate-binding protein